MVCHVGWKKLQDLPLKDIKQSVNINYYSDWQKAGRMSLFGFASTFLYSNFKFGLDMKSILCCPTAVPHMFWCPFKFGLLCKKRLCTWAGLAWGGWCWCWLHVAGMRAECRVGGKACKLREHATIWRVAFHVAVDGKLLTVWQTVMFSVSALLASEKGYKCTLFMQKAYAVILWWLTKGLETWLVCTVT